MNKLKVSRRRFIKIACAAAAVIVAGEAVGYYPLPDQGAPPATQQVSTTVTQFSSKSSTQTTKAPLPPGIGFKMQFQETTEWCWIAVATSINHFYNPDSTLTQGELMSIVGQTINKWPSTTQCDPSTADLESNPKLASILADPYRVFARYVLNEPTLKIPAVCVKRGGVADALDVRGNRNGKALPFPTLAAITQEMEAKRPIAVDIKWKKDGAQHCIAIAGVQDDMLLICDPIFGESAIQYETFPDTYQGGASWVFGYLTKKGS